MIRIGFLHHRKDPTKVLKAYAYAAIAQAEGAELVYFSPHCVQFEDSTILGHVYENGEWRQKKTPFPDVIYNTGSPMRLAKAKDIIDRLKQEIPFTTNSIGNKMRVYDRLKEAEEFSQYLIPSEILNDTKHFFQFIDAYRRVVFKPLNGRKGQGILMIERAGNDFRVLDGTESKLLSYDELKDVLSEELTKEPFIVQPFIICKTKSGLTFDFRLHVQKNGEGEWVITSIYPRIGASGSIVSNINNGGSTNYPVPFLKQEFGNDFFNVKRYLEIFSLQLAHHMDDIQQKKFSETIDELGIDVALDDRGKIWLYEINWRPGCPPTFYLEMDVVKNTIQYCYYLARKHQEEKKGEGELEGGN